MVDGNVRVVALLDRPRSESFGMVPVVVERERKLYVNGLASESAWRSRDINEKYVQLRDGGQLYEVNDYLCVSPDLINPAALWVGHQFRGRAEELQAPALPLLDGNWLRHSQGYYTLQEPAQAYQTLENWVNAAGVSVLTRDDNSGYDIATLMKWTLPSADETLAALYYTAPTDEFRTRELAWQERIERKSADELIQLHERTRDRLFSR